MARQTEFVLLSNQERRSLETLFSGGNGANRQHTRARILDLPARNTKASEIDVFLECSPTTVYNVKYRYQAEGLESALTMKPRSGKSLRLTGEQKVRITALACS